MTKLLLYKGALMACAVAAPPATYIAHKPISRAVHYVRRHIVKEPVFKRHVDTITTDSLPLCVGHMPDIDELIPPGENTFYGGGGGSSGGAYFVGGGGNNNGGHVTPAVPESATWAMMVVGFGGVGWGLRRRNLFRPQPAVSVGE